MNDSTPNKTHTADSCFQGLFFLLKNVEKHIDKAFRDLRCKAARNTLRGVTVKGFLGQNLHETQYDI